MKSINFIPLDFRLEVISYYAQCNQEEEHEIIQNFSNYGMKKDELNQLFHSFTAYKAKIEQEIPIIQEDIKDFFNPLSFTKDTLINSFYRFYMHQIKRSFFEIKQLYFTNIIFELDEEKEWNLSDIFLALEKHEMNDREKLSFIHLFVLDDWKWNEFISFLDEGAKILKKYYYLVQNEYEKSVTQIQSNPQIIEKINQTLHSKQLIQDNCDIYVSLFQFNRLSVIMQDDLQYVHIGYLFYLLVELKKQYIVIDQTVLNRLKVIADPSRFKILQLLKNEEYYAQELAKLINLTTATLSHHMEILTGEGLVEVVLNEQNKKNIYFRLNKKEMNQLIDDWKRSFSL